MEVKCLLLQDSTLSKLCKHTKFHLSVKMKSSWFLSNTRITSGLAYMLAIPAVSLQDTNVHYCPPLNHVIKVLHVTYFMDCRVFYLQLVMKPLLNNCLFPLLQ